MGIWALLEIAAFSCIGACLGSYLREKGKNLATRQDIAGLTEIVEDIKRENTMLVERFRSKQQLRYAALDKRLEAHQEAFELWRNLNFCVYRKNPEQIEEEVDKCIKWWVKNCLYLEPAARSAFSEAITQAKTIHVFVTSPFRDDPSLDLSKRISESTIKLGEAGNVIMAAVALPLLTESEETLSGKPDNHQAL